MTISQNDSFSQGSYFPVRFYLLCHLTQINRPKSLWQLQKLPWLVTLLMDQYCKNLFSNLKSNELNESNDEYILSGATGNTQKWSELDECIVLRLQLMIAWDWISPLLSDWKTFDLRQTLRFDSYIFSAEYSICYLACQMATQQQKQEQAEQMPLMSRKFHRWKDRSLTEKRSLVEHF